MTCIHRLRRSRSAASAAVVFLLASAFQARAAYAIASETTTTLTATSAATPIARRTIVTLTAKVFTGTAPGTPVTAGTVNFCNAAGASCTDVNLLGSAQLNASGVATISLPGIATSSYSAVFVGTIANSPSTSATQTLPVSGLFPTTTTISKTGTVGNYALTATVVGTVSSAGVSTPSGQVSFRNTGDGNATIATATLGAVTPTSLAQSFVSPTGPATGAAPGAIAVGDFNGDGFPDLAILNSTNKVSIFLNKADDSGTFKLPVTSTVGTGLVAIAAGDFDNNGTLDLAVVDTTAGNMDLLLGNGDGTFTASAARYSIGTGSVALAVGDFDHDGFLDLAVVNATGQAVSVLINHRDGTFTTPAPTYATGAGPASIATGDFNHDGFLDLAVVNSADKTVSVFINSGDGTFTVPGPTYATGVGPGSVVAGDYNGDGVLDLAVVNSMDGTVSVLLGHAAMPGIGDGTFSAQTTYPAGADPVSLDVGDFSGDGVADLAVVNQAGKTVSVLVGKGDGTFSAATPPTYSTGNRPGAIVVGDFSADGVTDLAVANSASANVTLLLDQLTQTATATATAVQVSGFGTQTIDASYPADGTFAGSTSTSPTTVAVMGSTTSVLVISSSRSSNLNQSVTFTATVSPTNGTERLAGSVTFALNGVSLNCGPMNPVPINSNTGIATCTTDTLPAGMDLIIATFNGSGYATSNSSVNQSVNAASSTTTLVSSSNARTSTVNDSVTFTATVTPSTQHVPLTGTVAFTLGSTTGLAVSCSSGTFVPSTGMATCVTTSLMAGTDVIVAAYINDLSYGTSNKSISQTVNKAPISVEVKSSSAQSNISSVNESVTFTAKLSTPNKTVAFGTGATLVFRLESPTGPTVNCSAASLPYDPTSGMATCITTALAAGTVSIYAVFAGDPNYQSNNGTVSQTVNPAKTSLLVTSSSPNGTSNVNDPVTFTATLGAANKTVSFATAGTISFRLGSATGPAVNCNLRSVAFSPATGTATCVTSVLAAGADAIYATYGADPNYQASTGNVSQTVKAAATSVVVMSSSPANSSKVNDSATFTATVTTTGKIVAFATQGTVTFSLNSTAGPSVICTTGSTRFEASTGMATCVTTSLTAGTDVIVATYNFGGTSDPNYQPSNNSVSQVVTASPTNVTVSSSSTGNTSNVNDPVTFTATLGTTNKTVAFATAGAFSFRTGSATGSPVKCISGLDFDPATGIATCVTTSLVAGTDLIYATYSGDVNYASSNGQVSQTVKSATSQVVQIVSTFAPGANALAVDQPVMFTATVGPANQPVPPKGNVTFLIDGQMANCVNALDANKPNIVTTTSSLIATCILNVSKQALEAASHIVTATYNADSSDPNYLASPPMTFSQPVQSATTTINVISSQPDAVSTQAITFTATVVPQYAGSVPPAGIVAFSSPDGTADSLCKAQAVSTAAGLSQAICTVAFPRSTGGKFDVTATYTSSDPNFKGNQGSASQTIRNVGLGISVGGNGVPKPVTVTQGYTNASDPFNSVAIDVTAGPVEKFNDHLSLSCAAPAGSGLSCSVPGTLNGDGTSSLPITLAASKTATVGLYTITVLAIDADRPALSQTTVLTNVYVAAASTTVSLVPGAVGATQVAFPLPSGVKLTDFSCPTAYGDLSTPNPTIQDTSKLLITCTVVPATLANNYLVTLSTTPPVPQSSALFPPWRGGLTAFACLGLPFFFAAGWRRNKRFAGRDIFRGLGALVLIIGLTQFTGCSGGSFQPPPLAKPGTGTPSGDYLVHVIGTGSDKLTYQASVSLVVSQ